MVKRLAKIEAGKVVNVAVVDPENIPAEMAKWPDAGAAGIGWTYDGRTFMAPVPPDQTTQEQRAAMVASPAQMRLALLAAGRLDTVEAIVAADPRASIVWEYSTTYRRTSPMIDALGGPGGFAPEEIDALFIAAAQIDTGAAQ